MSDRENIRADIREQQDKVRADLDEFNGRPLVTRRAPRSLTLGEVPDDKIPALIRVELGTGDCSMCGSAVRQSGWAQHWHWHHNIEGYGFPGGKGAQA